MKVRPPLVRHLLRNGLLHFRLSFAAKTSLLYCWFHAAWTSAELCNCDWLQSAVLKALACLTMSLMVFNWVAFARMSVWRISLCKPRKNLVFDTDAGYVCFASWTAKLTIHSKKWAENHLSSYQCGFLNIFSCQNLLRSLSSLLFLLRWNKNGAKKCLKSHIPFDFRDDSISANSGAGKTVEKPLNELPWNQQFSQGYTMQFVWPTVLYSR